MKKIIFRRVGELKPKQRIEIFGKRFYVNCHQGGFTYVANHFDGLFIIPSCKHVKVLYHEKGSL